MLFTLQIPLNALLIAGCVSHTWIPFTPSCCMHALLHMNRSDCSENYFEIYDNPDCTGFMATRRRRCSDPGHPFYSFSNVACVRYHSGAPGGSQDLTGLKIAFAADDENECFFPRICEHVCVNTPGGYHCTCPEGYFLSADGSSCFGKCCRLHECSSPLPFTPPP